MTKSRRRRPTKNTETVEVIRAKNTERMEKEKIEAEQKKDFEKIQELKTEIYGILSGRWHDPRSLSDKKQELYMLIDEYNMKYGQPTSGRLTKKKRKGKKRKGKKRKKGGTGTRTRRATKTKTKTRRNYKIKHHHSFYF